MTTSGAHSIRMKKWSARSKGKRRSCARPPWLATQCWPLAGWMMIIAPAQWRRNLTARCFGTRFGQKFEGGLALLKAIVEEVKPQHCHAVMANIRKRCQVSRVWRRSFKIHVRAILMNFSIICGINQNGSEFSIEWYITQQDQAVTSRVIKV